MRRAAQGCKGNNAAYVTYQLWPAERAVRAPQPRMIAWMRAWSTCMPNTVTEVISPAVAIPSCPQDIRAQLAVLLAGLILSQQLEVTP